MVIGVSMTDDERNKIVEDYLPLVHSVMVHRLGWAIPNRAGRGNRQLRRAVDSEDLVQVGVIGLMRATEKVGVDDPRFTGYAAKAIYNAMLNYIGANATPVTTGGWRGGNEKYHSAQQCISIDEADIPLPARRDDGPSLEDTEWVDHCMGRLRGRLSEAEYDILLAHAEGVSLRTIAAGYGRSGEGVRQQLQALMFKCRHLLYLEARNLWK